MTSILWIVISSIILCTTATSPNCCFNVTHFASFLSTFPCNIPCDLQQPSFDKCISCLTSSSNVFNQSGKISFGLEILNLTRPVVTCQDLYQEDNMLTGRIGLTWSRNFNGPNFTPQSSLYLVEARNSALEKWRFVGMTNITLASVNNLYVDIDYQFRITTLVTPNFTLPHLISDWISITEPDTNFKKSLNLTSVNFKYVDDAVEAVIHWTTSKDYPCSFVLNWLPSSNYYGQKAMTIPFGSSSVVLSNLLFQTNYTLRLSPLDYTERLKMKSTDMSFVTPSCLTLTRGSFSLCAPGPPTNFSVTWISDTQAMATWFPPEFTSLKNRISGYYLSVVEASEKYHAVLYYKQRFVFNRDIFSATVSDLKSSVVYMFEIQASSIGGRGTPITYELNLREPSRVSQHISEIPWHYVLPFSILAIGAILIALMINLCRMKNSSKVVSYPSGTADVPDAMLPYLLQSKKLDVYDVIGKGEFGVVHKGVYNRNKDKEMVAVKTFSVESVSRSKLLHEVQILQTIGRHSNIVGLIGFTLEVDKISLVLEYCPLGNLLTRVQKLKKELTVIKKQLSDPKQPLLNYPKDKNEHYGIKVSSYIHQIALGMEYISSLNLIHRDLAARNILLHTENNVKIADFGLAKDVSETHSYSVSKQKKLPIRWMAPESLEKQIFTTQSDVWSFGVLMWEVFKFGKVPYAPLNNSAVLLYIKNGYRLPKPNATSRSWYDLMLECWQFSPHKRPSFKELVTKTENILGKLCQYTVVVTD